MSFFKSLRGKEERGIQPGKNQSQPQKGMTSKATSMPGPDTRSFPGRSLNIPLISTVTHFPQQHTETKGGTGSKNSK